MVDEQDGVHGRVTGCGGNTANGAAFIEAKEARPRDVLRHKDAGRAKSRARASRGEHPHFMVGDFVLVARVRTSGPQAKLMTRWIVPWRVVSDDREHVYTVQHLVSGETPLMPTWCACDLIGRRRWK